MVMVKLPFLSFGSVFRYQAEEAKQPVVNPLKGWAPWIDDDEPVYPVSMVYVRMHWSEVEPEEGVYCFEQLEQENHMAEWRKKGVRFVIRLVCDTPSEEKHMDIPQWLYDKTYGDGDWYDGEYGKGYSPNYANPVFIEKHAQLIRALAEYYGEDPLLGYIQLGSLGHWGEWHVNEEAGIRAFPKAAVYEKYIQAYLDVFPASRLMLRRPVTLAKESFMGLFNDSFGVVSSHETWLSWITDGYYSGQSDEELPGMPEFWKMAPSGGEFATTYDESYYFSEGFEETMRLMKESHTTFLGPRGGAYVENPECREQIETMSREMGYCFRLTESTLTKPWWSQAYYLTIGLDNIGVAPFYGNWPMMLYVQDQNGVTVYAKECETVLLSLLPGQHEIRMTLDDVNGLPAGSYTMAVGIIDPWTKEDGVAFANGGELGENRYKIMEFTIE